MIIKLPNSVRFPITITELLRQANDDVARLDPLLIYTFKLMVKEYPEYGVEVEVEKELSSQFYAPIEGKLTKWLVESGTVLENNSVAIVEIEEPCSHEVQFAGLCTMCGEDMTLLDYNSYFSNSDRATIQLAHDNSGLTVSEDEARKLEEQAKRRLLKERKLSLVVDLDQTIIHATVDPTVGEWKDDPFCVNHESVKDVQAFKLDEDISGGRGTWYYVKMRPGLKEFLEHISQLFELHIYTMGTRAYALAVKKIVDPDGTLFGERVLSRDESGSMTQKCLHRLFPVDTKMVVIIDDRGDVWKWNDNLVKVRPYDFFVGIGDINSMFLPKKQEFPAASLPEASPPNPVLAVEEKEEGEKGLSDEAANPTKATSSANMSALEQLITMGSGSDQQLITDQASELDKAIEAQKEDRPLAKKQELQDKIDEKAAELAATTEDGDAHKDIASEGGAQKHSVLQDNDWELSSLKTHLSAVHERFYFEYETNKRNPKDRVSQLRDAKKHPRKRGADGDDGLDLGAVPDVATIMPTMKKRALSGVVLVFSGVIPLGADVQSSDIAVWAKSFGAVVIESISGKVTHVVAARSRTAKVRQATRYPHVRIVSPHWLYDSISNWQHEPEDNYLIEIHPEDRHNHSPTNGILKETAGPLLSSEDEDTDDEDDYDSELDPEGASQNDGLDMSNVGWKDVDEEFAEYFGDDDFDESDNESVKTVDMEVGKRKRVPGTKTEGDGEGGDSTEEEEASGDTRSRLAKRQKIARDRAAAGSTLRDVEVSMENVEMDLEEQNEGESESDSLADELERELMGLDDMGGDHDGGTEGGGSQPTTS